ncbi:UvrD-helicase domain-containing protein, partial [bacterium]|nr:UvrD-helicase domain-containing protein [bacterium]
NSITEMNYSLEQLHTRGKPYSYLADAIEEFRQQTEASFICDQSSIQLIFREFLDSPLGESFIGGDSEINPGIRRLLVDEYQDTNPIQEEIYFTIASRIGNNICVVGDDDQSLYRFRGGTVELMTNFGQRARERL